MATSILIVEDDRVVARDIQQQIRRLGYTIAGTAATGEDAVQVALDTSPSLVLMDIRLAGDIDGIEAARKIKARNRVPIIFLTAYADDETVRRAASAEPFGYLLKPFEENQLRTAIEIALYKHATERKLRESERRYATTLSSIGDAVIATDSLGKITFMNPVAESLTRWTMVDALALPVTDVFKIVNEDTRQTVEDPIAKVLRLGTTVGLANHTILVAKDGSELPIDDCGSPIIDDDGNISGAVLVFRDVTHRKQMDDALRDAQSDLALVARLTRLGELAASIAHEINQPLTAILSNAETCARYLEEAKAAAERVANNSQRAGEVIKSIRSLGSNTQSRIEAIDINQVIGEVVELLRSEIRRHGAVVETSLTPNLPKLLGDRTQLQQVVLNILTNALEAMTIRDGLERRVLITSGVSAEGQAMVSVTDSGVGLSPGEVDKVFEAMFTTKREGMGLGLSICRSIVEAHGGRIWASSGVNPGATFNFTVPMVSHES
jgi:two-component system, cell cycle sensor histidine kinase and response regulator CckA